MTDMYNKRIPPYTTTETIGPSGPESHHLNFIASCNGIFWKLATPTGDIFLTDQICLSYFVEGHHMTVSAKP